MKTVKSALLGSRRLLDSSPDVLLAQLKDVLKEHRAVVINSLMANIPTYMDYKFKVKTTADLYARVKTDLTHLQDATVDLKKYDAVVVQLMKRDVIRLSNEPFYKEIDECLSVYAAAREIKFA